METVICKAIVIQHPCLTSPWIPDVKTIDGADFIHIRKWDRGLAKYCSGKALNLSKGKSTYQNMSFFDKLVKARNEACDRAVATALAVDDEEGGEPQVKRVRRARPSDRDIVSPIVNVEMEGVCRGAVCIETPYVIRCSFDLKSSDVWVELTMANLEFIRHSFLRDLECNSRGQHWRPLEDRLKEKGRVWFSKKASIVYVRFTNHEGVDGVKELCVHNSHDAACVDALLEEARAFLAENHHEELECGDRGGAAAHGECCDAERASEHAQ
jgi:hypothetical protein